LTANSLSCRRAERALTYRVTSDNTTLMSMMNSMPIYLVADAVILCAEINSHFCMPSLLRAKPIFNLYTNCGN